MGTKKNEQENEQEKTAKGSDKMRAYIIRFHNQKTDLYQYVDVTKHSFAEAEVAANEQRHRFDGSHNDWRIVSIIETKKTS